MISPFFRKKDSADKQADQNLNKPAVQQDQPRDHSEEERDAAIIVDEEPQSITASLNKTNLDKRSLDLVFAVEQMIQAKQHGDRSINELQDRLMHANGHVERLKSEVKTLNKAISDREKNVLELENKLTERNLKVDQVMEDYRELQGAMNAEIEELKSAIDLEQQKYSGLLQKHNEALADKVKIINDFEDKLSRLEVENAHLKQKYETMRQEKTYLANMISDFTTRMSAPLGQNNNSNS